MEQRKIRFALLALLLAAMAIIPLVSAEEVYLCQGTDNCITSRPLGVNSMNPDEKIQNGPTHVPVIFDDLLVKGVEGIPNNVQRKEEYLFLEIPASVVSKSGNSPDDGLVTITVPTSSLAYREELTGMPAPVPDDLVSAEKSIDGPVVILWAPKEILSIAVSYDKTTITVPERNLLKYKSLEESRLSVKKSANENLLISHDTYPAGVQMKQVQNAVITSGDFAERSWYYDANTAHHVTGVRGVIDPSTSYNNGESYFSYHEMEIYLERDTDCIEFVSYHRPDGQIRIFVSIHDDYYLYTPLDIDATNLPYVNYYLSIDAPYWYTTRLQNPLTGTWYSNTWTDSDNFSRYIKSLRGSTELLSLQHVPPLYSFHTATNPITGDYIRNSLGIWVRPNQAFTDMGAIPNQQYVHGTRSWSSGRIVTTHESGSGVS